MQKRVAIYLRVSTSKQDTENQLRELSAVADRSGWDIWKVYEDAGISGAKGRDKRPGLDAMMKAVNAKQFDMVAAWSVDRLGRSLTDLLGILQELQEKGVDLFLHQQGLDTSTTAGKAMFQMLGAPHLGLRDDPSSTRPHDRAEWWDIARRHALDRLPSKLSLAGEGVVAAVPPPDAGDAARRTPRRPPAVLRRPRPPRRQGRVQGLSRAAASDQVVRL
jgi:hypothetical protein